MPASLRTALICALAAFTTLAIGRPAHAAGTLRPATAGDAPMRILDHHVEVLIDNGYARTEVTQTFDNPNTATVEAIYSLPLPLGAALAEVTIVSGDQTLHGEVVPREEARAIYDAQQAAGAQAGLATKEGYQRFEFRIAQVPAGEQVRLTFAYYQALAIDAGVGRYLYPLEEGGTDEGATFWQQNDVVEGTFGANITLRSAWPVEDVRIPDFEDAATITQSAPGEVAAEVRAQTNLDRDLVLYYRLPDDLPGRVEVIPYRDGSEKAGTFMMVLTPGVDLAPLSHGGDYVFVLDVSSSMEGKLDTLKQAVRVALDSLAPVDRYRVVTFSDTASELTTGWMSVGEVGTATPWLDGLQVQGGTNVHAGLALALADLDRERATSVLLVTDAVANEGLIDGPSFAALLQEEDVRVYGFLMGNSGNWALMELITDVSGGFYAQLSNADDIGPSMLQARERMTHEALHDFEVSFDGGAISGLSHSAAKVHRGQQVVVFGRYDEVGPVHLGIDAVVTGAKQHYAGDFVLPERDTANPELERLWAFARIRWLEYQSAMGLMPSDAAATEITELGVDYQLVTDETSMVLLSDEDFARLGIDPDNRERTATEELARMLREQGNPVDYSTPVDAAFAGSSSQGSSSQGSSSHGGSSSDSYDDDDGYGGGAVGGSDLAGLACLALLHAALRRRRARRHG